MAEYTAAQASVLIVPTLGKGANSFKTKLEEQLKTVRTDFQVQVKADTAKMIAEVEAAKKALEKDPINVRLATDKDGFEELKRHITEVRHEYDDVASKFKKGLAVNVTVGGLASLQALIPALGAVNASITQLAQTSLVLPGIVAGVASSMAAAVVGSSGLATAFKAQTSASKDVANAARQQADANRAVKDSTRELNNAVKDAKRNLQDLNDQLREAPTDEAEAMLNLQQAQYEASQKFGKSLFEQQKDALSVRKAEDQLYETRKRNVRLQQDVTEANSKGISGNDSVVSATNRLTKALEDQAKQTGPLNDLAQAMAKLSPSAADFVNQVKSLGGAWTDLRKSVQDRLFANLGGDITQLAGKDLPLLKKGLGDIAGAINGNLRAAIASLGSDSSKGFLEKIFGNTADAQNLLTRAVNPLVDSFLKLGAAGSAFLPRMADGVGDLLKRFDNFIGRAKDDGSLDKWINNGIDTLKQLGNSLLNIGSIMNSVTDAFTGSGGKTFSKWLEDNTKRLATFLKGPEGQTKLKDFFTDARAELQKWEPVIKDIPGIVKNIAVAIKEWAGNMLPFLNTVAPILKDHPGLVNAIFTAYMGWKSIGPVLSGLKFLLSDEAGGIVGAAKKAGSAIGDAFKAGKASGGLKGGLSGALSGLASLVSPGGIVMVGLGAVAAFLTHEWLQAQQNAADAVSHHADMVAQLKQNLDELSGSLSQKGLIDQINQLSAWQDPNNHMAKADIPAIANQLGLTDQFTKAINPTDQKSRDQFSQTVRDRLKGEVEKPGNLANTDHLLQEAMKRGNFSTDDLVDALLNRPGAVDKFKALNSGYSLSDIAYGNKTGIPGGIGDKPGLSDTGQKLVELNKATNETVDTALQQGGLNRATGQSLAGGPAELKAGTPFDGLGPRGVFYHTNRDGGALIEVNTPMDQIPPDLIANIKANGGSLAPLANGSGTQIDLDADRAKLYVQPGHATGGLLSGAGTGTSDSMMIRASNGEYMIRADSVGKYGPAFLAALNEGRVDPQDLPGFAGGGLIGGGFKLDAPFVGPIAPPTPAPAASFDPHFDPQYRVPSPFDNPIAPRPDLAGQTPGQVLTGAGRSTGIPQAPAGGGGSLSTDAIAAAHGDSGVSFYKRWYPVPKAPAPAPLPSTNASTGLTGPTTPTATFDPATGKFSGSLAGLNTPTPTLKPGRDGDPGNTPGPNLPPTDPQSPFYRAPNAHLGPNGPGSPGPGNAGDVPPTVAASGVPSAPGAGFQPGGSGTITLPNGQVLTQPTWQPSAGDPLGLGSLPDTVQPVSILEQIGAILLDAVTGFFGIDPSYLNIGKQIFTGAVGKNKGPRNANAGVADILNGGGGILDANSPYAPSAQRASNMADLMAGKPYTWGGAGLDGTDCSGLVMYVADAYEGKPFGGRTGGTQGFMQSIPSKGGVIIGDPSQAPPGTLRVGWNDHHTAGTLPDGRNFESSTFGKPIAVGANASGYNDPQFDHWAYFPAPAGDTASPTAGGLSGNTGGANWDAMSLKESSGNWGANTGNGFYGGLQFTQSSWELAGGLQFAQRADLATPAQQKQVAKKLLSIQGPGAWPNTFTPMSSSALTNPGLYDPASGTTSPIPGFASGGYLSGPGTGTSDSMLARVSNGEMITRASSVAKYGRGFMHALNKGKIDPNALPRFADGTGAPVQIPGVGSSLGAGQSLGQLPPPDQAGQQQTPGPANDPNAQSQQPPITDTAAQTIGDSITGAGDAGTPGAQGDPNRPDGKQDPRSILGAAPAANADHNAPGITQGIQGAFSTAGSIAGMAASMGLNAAAPGAGSAAGAGIQAGAQIAGQVASGAVNILSSLLVGTATGGTTPNPYGAPVLPQGPPQSGGQGPAIVNNYGDIHTANYDEFYKGQQRREAQQQAPILPVR